MRRIYISSLIHIFDFFTDLIVIYEWYKAEDSKNEDVEHIDSHIMAYCSIGV